MTLLRHPFYIHNFTHAHLHHDLDSTRNIMDKASRRQRTLAKLTKGVAVIDLDSEAEPNPPSL